MWESAVDKEDQFLLVYFLHGVCVCGMWLCDSVAYGMLSIYDYVCCGPIYSIYSVGLSVSYVHEHCV